jgi:predicted nucleotidyltransferase
VASIPEQERAAIRAFLAEKEARRKRILDERFSRARADADRIVHMIAERFAPRRIYQWGSLLDRRRFQEISDIDIAVEGLTSVEKIFSIYAAAEKMTDLPIDIVEIEKIHPLHAQAIREQGTVVYVWNEMSRSACFRSKSREPIDFLKSWTTIFNPYGATSFAGSAEQKARRSSLRKSSKTSIHVLKRSSCGFRNFSTTTLRATDGMPTCSIR